MVLLSKNNRTYIDENFFKNADDAFNYYYDEISNYGRDYDDTKCLFNIGFYILDPLDNRIYSEYRSWNSNYAEKEWQWYLNMDPSAIEISKHAKIWINHMDKIGNVNSNYGYQWNRENQLYNIINKLMNSKETRQAWLTIYDGKEIDKSEATINGYESDTPCTLNIGFNIIDDSLCMTVLMRSNDLWYGFCNDQYCFSMLQRNIAKTLNIKVGWYYHFANNLHIYNNKLNKKNNGKNGTKSSILR